MRTLFFPSITAVLILLSSCGETKQAADNSPKDNVQNADMHNSMNSLDWAGIYSGVFPCIDCEEMYTTIELNPDLTYVKQERSLKDPEKINNTSGKFTWNTAGNAISLNGEPEKTQFFVGENSLSELKPNGEKLLSEAGESVVLTKELPQITEKYWKLSKLQNREIEPVEENRREAHFVLRSEENRITGNSSCNSFFGTYKLSENNGINFSQIGATKMACASGMGTENELFKAFEEADNYELNGDQLSLKSGEKELASFQAVYFH